MLLYDTFWHPSKYAYNLEYISIGLRCLEEMVNDEPITNARNSIRQILKAVEQAIFSTPADRMIPTPATGTPSLDAAPQQPAMLQSNIHFPSFANTVSPASTDDFIYFNSRYNRAENQPDQQSGATSSSVAAAFPSGTWTDDPMSSLDYDVLTTDLFNFLPAPLNPNSADVDFSQA